MGFVVDFFNGRSRANNARDFVSETTDQLTGLRGEAIDRSQPFVDAGAGAQELINSSLGIGGASPEAATQAFQSSPFFQLPFTEGLDAIEGGAAARGGLLSGQASKDLIGFSQNFANNNFSNFFQGLTNTALSGQNENRTLGGVDSRFGDNLVSLGEAQLGAENQSSDANAGLANGIIEAFTFGLF